MVRHVAISDQALRGAVRRGELIFAGNSRLKIYGQLGCSSGKRMKKAHRVFFGSQSEALDEGYRPCGHCLGADYKKWKDGFIQSDSR